MVRHWLYWDYPSLEPTNMRKDSIEKGTIAFPSFLEDFLRQIDNTLFIIEKLTSLLRLSSSAFLN